MRRILLSLAILLLATPCYAADFVLHEVPIQVYFSPNGGVQAAVVKSLDDAERSIRVQAYSFTSAPIAKALVDAHNRGVNVEVILDKSPRTEKYSGATFLANAGIPVWIDAAHAIAHNKVMVIDQSRVITGSFNFTKAAEERNAENLLILDSPELARAYLDNYEGHKTHSAQYESGKKTVEALDHELDNRPGSEIVLDSSR